MSGTIKIKNFLNVAPLTIGTKRCLNPHYVTIGLSIISVAFFYSNNFSNKGSMYYVYFNSCISNPKVK